MGLVQTWRATMNLKIFMRGNYEVCDGTRDGEDICFPGKVIIPMSVVTNARYLYRLGRAGTHGLV